MRIEKTDRVRFYHDADGEIFGVVINVDDTIICDIKGDNGKNYTIPMKALDKIPMTDITVQKHNGVTTHASMESAEFFSMLTLATNYANERLQQIKRDGFKNFVITDPGVDNKIRLLRESYQYWEKEYEKLVKLTKDLRV